MDCYKNEGVAAERYSVLMAVYGKDHPEWFEMAVESMVQQSLAPDEILIIQDGPLTDALNNTLDGMIARHPQLIRTIALEKNAGLGNALRLGVQECRNEWIARMDSDDISDKFRCEKELRKAAAVGADIVGCDSTEFKQDVAVVESRRVYPETHEELLRFSKRRSPFCHPSVMMRKSMVLKAGNYQPAYLHEDYDLFIRMLSAGARACTVKEDLFHFRVNEKMYHRRGGMRYVGAMLHFNYVMWKRGWTSPVDLIVRSCGNILFGFVPAGIREWLYRRLLRK